MPHFESIPAGFPCWLELGTTDQQAAKNFYTSLFGWTVADFPMGPDGTYSIFSLGSDQVAAAYKLTPQMEAEGVPPNWCIYFAVENVDESTVQAKGLGAAVIMGPMDVMDAGRMSVLSDPAGAVFCLWQSKSHRGFGVAQEVHSLLWSELATRDMEGAEKFYSSLFGWQTKGHPTSPGEYLICSNAGMDFGGIMKITEDWGDVPPHWTPYYWVKSCSESVDKVKELGGTACVGPFHVPGVGWIAVCDDPQGAKFCLIEPQPMEKP
jgi:uncharacterized protein